MPGRRELLLGGLVLGGALAASALRPRSHGRQLSADRLDAAVPDRLGPYRREAAQEIVLPDRDVDSLAAYQQYVARSYVAPGSPPIALLIAYGAAQDYALQLHRPESCYPPAGFELSERRVVPLQLAEVGTIDAVAMTARRLDRVDQLLYWTRVGDVFPDGIWAQRWAMTRELLQRQVPDGVLVRLSTPATGPGAIATLAAFNRLLLAGVAPVARRLMLGVSAASRA